MKRIILAMAALFLQALCFAADFRVISDTKVYDGDYHYIDELKKGDIVQLFDCSATTDEKLDFAFTLLLNMNGKMRLVDLSTVIPNETSELFDERVRYTTLTTQGKNWIPVQNIDILRSRSRDRYYETYKNKLARYDEPDIFQISWHEHYKVRTAAQIENCFLYFTDEKNYAIFLYVKDIKPTGNGYMVSCEMFKSYTSDLFVEKNDFLENLNEKGQIVNLLLIFDGDYLHIYTEKKQRLFTYALMDSEYSTQMENLIRNETCDLSKVTWPRHADGTCDYEKANGIATAATSENANKEESANTPATERAEPTEKAAFPDAAETPNEEEDAKKAATLPIVPIAVGVAVLAVLLAAILLAAKKSKAVKMKKNVGCILLFLVSTIAFSQTILYKGEQIFLIANDYEIIHDCNAYEIDKQAKKFVKTETIIEKGHVVTSEIYEKFWGISTLGIGNNNFIDTPDYKIAENDSFPAQSVCSVVNAETSARWIPEWYFYALERKDRNLIAEAEPGRDTWDGDAIPDVWYKAIPQVSSLVLTNAGMTMYTPLQAQAVFLFQNLKKNPDGKFEATAYPDINDTDNDVFWKPNKENFPALQNGSPVKFRFEINGKEMKIYNGETGKLCFDLIQMPAEWAVLYEDFIRTNKVPAGLYLPEEYLKRKNGGSPGGDDSAKKGPELTDALITAAKNNNAAKARRLIAAGADVNAKDDDGKTALMLAAWANSVDVVKLLLAADADVNAKDKDGWTALMRAAARDAMDAVRLLLAAGADVNGINRNGGTALMNAAVGNSADIVRLLIESGADMNAQDEFGWTALMCAARENSADVAEILLDAGADVNTKADGGRTALMCAAARDAVDVVKLLLAAGADVDAKLNNGATALMLAAQYNFMDAARLLIAAGADMSAKDNRGRSALMLATEFKAADVAELLRAADRESADAPAVGKTAAVTENLRLRTDDRTAEVIATLAAGTRVKILAVGRKDTIDGIASNWVRVAALSGAQDRDGNAVAAGTQGWLFGGYLSEVESAESGSPSGETDAAKAPALPIVPVVAGVAVLAILLAAILLVVRKRKGGKE